MGEYVDASVGLGERWFVEGMLFVTRKSCPENFCVSRSEEEQQLIEDPFVGRSTSATPLGGRNLKLNSTITVTIPA